VRPPRPDAASNTDRTTDERNLIDRARSALARGKPHDALLALMQHERSFADGALREDREFLIIRALVAQDKRDLAKARADIYKRDHPRGSYLDAIDRLLTGR
jgi:hypothetical protein